MPRGRRSTDSEAATVETESKKIKPAEKMSASQVASHEIEKKRQDDRDAGMEATPAHYEREKRKLQKKLEKGLNKTVEEYYDIKVTGKVVKVAKKANGNRYRTFYCDAKKKETHQALHKLFLEGKLDGYIPREIKDYKDK